MKTLVLTMMIKIWFLDIQTNDTLPAVKVTTDKNTYYTNLDGYIDIPKDEKILKISHNTYKTMDDIKIENDTTILLKQY